MFPVYVFVFLKGDELWLCSWNTTYESVLATKQPFRKPVPLSVSLYAFS